MDVRKRAAAELVERVNNELSNYNYSVAGELNASENGSVVIFTVTCTESEADNYPTLELALDRFTDENGHEIWVAIPTLSFPTLVYNLEDDYQDSIEYYLSRWAKLGRAITQINKIDFDYTDFAEQDSSTVESATDIEAASTEVAIHLGDEEIVYSDPDGMFGDVGTVSLADIKEYWTREHEYDPSLAYYDSFDEWFADTRQWLRNVEACEFPLQASSKEAVLSWSELEEDEEDEDTGWRELSSKMVPDSDGFMTDYTLYESTSPYNSCMYICMFGDKDIYKPDESYADMTFDDLGEAEDWFYSYEGLVDDEEEILSDSEVHLSEDEPQMCWRVYVDGEITGTFFSDALANAHAAEFIAQGYDANRVDVVFEEYWHEDSMSPKDVIVSSSFCYALKHGFGPGTIPKDVDVLNFKDEGYLTIVELDRELTPEELDYYDIRIVE